MFYKLHSKYHILIDFCTFDEVLKSYFHQPDGLHFVRISSLALPNLVFRKNSGGVEFLSRFLTLLLKSSTWGLALTAQFTLLSGLFIWSQSPFSIDCVFLSCHIRVQGKSSLCNWLNVKKLLAKNKRNIWNLSDCNRIRAHNHLVCKQTFNHFFQLAKWLSCVVRSYLYGAPTVCLYHVIYTRLEWIYTLCLPKC